MKYFTPEIIIRGNSLDDSVVEGVEEDWEQAIKRYNRRWTKIKTTFPKEVRRFDVCLHDADVLSMGRQGDEFVMVVHKEPPSQEMVVLLFTLDGEPEIDPDALPGRNHASYGHWMYEEFDLDRQKKCRFEVLLSNGWLLKLPFKDFRYWVTQKVLAGENGQVIPVLNQVVTRSA
jgi:hypothetical protein